MNRYPYRGPDDLICMQALRLATRPTEYLSDFPSSSDLLELLAQPAIRAQTALWWDKDRLLAYALVDTRYCNLYFELLPEVEADLAPDLVAWAELSLVQHKSDALTLDAACPGEHQARTTLLEACGFVVQEVKTLNFSRDLAKPFNVPELPSGYAIRTLTEEDVEAAVTLHRIAFGTDFFTPLERRAMMARPDYSPELDLLIVALDGALAASVFGSTKKGVGFTDPICVHPGHQGKGLARSLLLHAFARFKKRGTERAALTTSSENHRAVRVFESVGFELKGSKTWFEKPIRQKKVLEVA